MAEEPRDPWQWWRDQLSGASGPALDMNESNPHAGFYRQPRKAYYGARKTYLPVAYWPGENGDLNCRIGDEDVTPEKGRDTWVSVGRHPVTEEAYRAVAERGEPWPDEHELVPMGDNLPPEDNSFEGLRDAIEPLADEASKRIKGPPVQNQNEADRLANLGDELSRLWKLADEQRKIEQKPHDQGLLAVREKWRPLLAAAEIYRDLKKKLVTPWLDKETARLKAEAEAAAAAGAPPQVSDTRRPRAGTRGRAMTLKSQKRAEIVDYAVCLDFFKDSPDVKATVQDLANRAVRSGVAVPGTRTIEESQAV